MTAYETPMDRTRKLENCEAVKAAETKYLNARRARLSLPTGDPPIGLALSGGGIRSAVFCLGILQALARKDQLKYFDYLSTVSGGGYIGSALTWWTSKLAKPLPGQVGVGPNNLPWGVEDPATVEEPGSLLLRHLRRHGSYLTPGHGITLLSGIGVVLRGIALNLVVWLPLITFIFALPVVFVGPNRWAHFYLAFGWIALVPALIFLVGSLIYSFRTAPRRGSAATRYNARREFDSSVGGLLVTIIAPLIIWTLPVVHHALGQYFAKVGIGSFIVGAVTGIGGLLKSPGRDQSEAGAGGIPLATLAPFAAILVFYGFALIAWVIALSAIAAPQVGYAILVASAVIALLSGYFVNLNYISPHRFYRDRLMEAFMPDLGKNDEPLDTSQAADPARLSAMCSSEHPVGPYHLINTNVILSGTKDPKACLRGGASFLLSPQYCGSEWTGGWFPTEKYLGDGMTLPTAMAISGAAINPDAAVDGIGPTRSKSISVLLALLNVRLGYWIAHPGKDGWRRPNHFIPGFSEFIDSSRSADGAFLQLSDGGHFENLGVYELVRRRARLIVAVDADQDGDFKFADLLNALSLVQQDFGALIEFGQQGLDPLMPDQPLTYPAGVTCSKKAILMGRITYCDRTAGTFFYVKSTLLKELRFQLRGYKDTDPSFPDDTTLNQFFDEQKFEAYRELGYAIGTLLSADAAFQQRLS